jgi:hypothetical protein
MTSVIFACDRLLRFGNLRSCSEDCHCGFNKQVHTQREDSNLVVSVAVRLPENFSGHRMCPIISKASVPNTFRSDKY